MATDEELVELQEKLKEAKKCAVCGSFILRNTGRRRQRTCSPECAFIWRNSAARFTLNEEEHSKHRESVARYLLKNPDKATESQKLWAKKMLSDDPPPPNRRYNIPGSISAEILSQVAPNKMPSPDGRPTWADIRTKFPEKAKRILEKQKARRKAATKLGQRHSKRRKELTNQYSGNGTSRNLAWQRALITLREEHPGEFEKLVKVEMQALDL